MVGNLLLRGMLAGILAGFFAFGFARIYGEPHVERAIAYEEVMAANSGEQPAAEAAEQEEEVSRATQAGLGLLVGSILYGASLGGLFALVFAFVHGRLLTLSPRATAALLAAAAFIAVGLAPALKYPATPPAVGSPETINERTVLFFVMLIVSVASAIIAAALARRLWRRLGAWNASIAGGLAFIGLIVIAQYALPTVNEIPQNYPADLLWEFRASSLGMHAVLWAVIGLAFGVLAEHALPSAARRRRA